MSAARSWPACTGSTAAGRTTSTISTGSCAVSEPRGAASPWNPQIAITIDLYSEDWPQLRGVMVQGTAKIIERGPRFKQARARLYATYPQYSIGAALSPADSAIVEVTPTHVSPGASTTPESFGAVASSQLAWR